MMCHFVNYNDCKVKRTVFSLNDMNGVPLNVSLELTFLSRKEPTFNDFESVHYWQIVKRSGNRSAV